MCNNRLKAVQEWFIVETSECSIRVLGAIFKIHVLLLQHKPMIVVAQLYIINRQDFDDPIIGTSLTVK